MGSRLRIAIAAIAALGAMALPGIARAEVFQGGSRLINFETTVAPTLLPVKTYAPVTLAYSMDFGATEGSEYGTAARIRLDLDSDFSFYVDPVPQCSLTQLENTTTSTAREECPASILGMGTADMVYTLPGQGPMPASGDVTVFRALAPQPSVVIHLYLAAPAPHTLIMESLIYGTPQGTALSFDIPPISGGYGLLTHFDFGMSRVTHARCGDGVLTQQPTVTYQGGATVTGTASRPCTQTVVRKKRKCKKVRKGKAKKRALADTAKKKKKKCRKKKRR